MKKKILKISEGIAIGILIPFYLIHQLLKLLLKPLCRLLKPVIQWIKKVRLKQLKERDDVYITEDGIILINCTRTIREKIITFITVIATAAFAFMVLVATITLL